MAARSLGVLTLDLVANIGGYVSGMDKAGREAEKLSARQKKAAKESAEAWASVGKTIGAGLAVGISALGAMVVSSINAADNLNDLSKTTGLTVETLSGLSLAAKQSGTDLEGVADSISKLSMNMGKDSEKFKALGISAKDPLEAFKQLSDLFVSIQDPQTRAALGAATLGKSWQSAAPLLAEGSANIQTMIDKGIVLSGVTQDMATEADKFNDELEELKTSAGGAATAIAGPLITSINDLMTTFKAARIAGRGFWESLSLGVTGSDELAKTVESNRKTLEKNAEKYGKDSDQYIDALHNLQVNMQRQSDAMAREPFVMPSLPTDGPTKTESQVKAIVDPRTKATKEARSELDKYIESLQKEIIKVDDLTRVEEVLAEVQSGRLGKVTASQKEYLIGLSEQVESIKATNEAWSFVIPSMEKAAESSQQLLLDNQALASSYLDIIDPTRELAKEIQKIKDLTEGGYLNEEESVKAIDKITEAWKKNNDEMDMFTKKAAENIQDSIGDGLVDIMDGNFKDIGSSFAKMLKQMAADALAANIARSLFGSMVAGGSGSGLLGGLLGSLGGIFGAGGAAAAGSANIAQLAVTGGLATGGPALGGHTYLVGEEGPELFTSNTGGYVMNAKQTAALASGSASGGGGLTYAPVIQIDSRTDRAQIMVEVDRANQVASAQLVDRLQRAGRI